jgi:putative membrane protein
MLEITDLPHVMAALNGISVVLLSAGYGFIRQGRWKVHRACMVAALVASAAFLSIYIYYKANAGFAQFGGVGAIRPVYFTILILHVLGAITLTPLVPVVVWRAFKQRFDRHRALARWTLPLWLYVGVSGIVVYVMAVHIYPIAP